MSAQQDWAVPGARVAVRESIGYGSRVRFGAVLKVTTAQVVLDDGTRADRETLRLRGKRGELLPLDDPQVTAAHADRVVSSLRSQVDRLLRDFDGSADEALALVAEMERLCAAGRAAIGGLTDLGAENGSR